MTAENASQVRATVDARNDECPVNTVDEHAARVVAFFTVVLAAASLYEPLWWLMVILAIDFAIRAWGNRRYSPLRWLAKKATRLFGLGTKPIYAPPKRFAARVGSTFTLVATLFYLLGIRPGGIAATVFLIIAASLEAFFGYCLACWLYPFVHRSSDTKLEG